MNITPNLGDENLVVIGTGIRTVGQLTMEAIAWLKRADTVFHIVADPIAEEVIKALNPKGEQSLLHFYGEGKDRLTTYHQMVDAVLTEVRTGKMVTFVAYGHPGVFAFPPHEAIRKARAEGYKAVMLPGISAEDCLFADLNIDPAMAGCQSYEATDFVLNGRIADNTSHVVLWQIGVLGDATYKARAYDTRGWPELLGKLFSNYPPNHNVYLYEAPIFIGVSPKIRTLELQHLPYAGATACTTLYIPPACPPRVDANVYRALGFWN